MHNEMYIYSLFQQFMFREYGSPFICTVRIKSQSMIIAPLVCLRFMDG